EPEVSLRLTEVGYGQLHTAVRSQLHDFHGVILNKEPSYEARNLVTKVGEHGGCCTRIDHATDETRIGCGATVGGTIHVKERCARPTSRGDGHSDLVAASGQGDGTSCGSFTFTEAVLSGYEVGVHVTRLKRGAGG